MNALSPRQTLHPVQWAAAISVTLLAITGIAAITGLLPVSKSEEAPPPQPAVTAPAAIPPAPVAAVPAASPKLTTKHAAPAEHRHVEAVARAQTVNEPVLAAPPPPPVCRDCGRIESIQRIAREGDGSGVGAVAGGVLGGALGNGIGHGNGRAIATVAGVIGGAMLGNKVEKSQKQSFSYQTVVRLDDGSSRLFDSASEPAWHNGERVRIVNGSLQPD